jgi:hypothetical protein
LPTIINLPWSTALKNLLSILLFGLLIFNMMGFSVYNIMEQNEAKEAAIKDDKDLLIKFPVAVPYLTDWQNAEEGEGELLHGTEYYNIVSKQIVNDTLYVKCRFNENARDRFWNLVSTFDDQVKTSQDHQKGASSFLLKSLLKEYMATGRKHTFFVLEWLAPPAIYQHNAFSFTDLPQNGIPAPPPDLA